MTHARPVFALALALATVAAATPARATEPGARLAAGRGLKFLAGSAKAWTNEKKCYGCHVQAVTLEAFAVGVHNQYAIANEDIAAMVAAMRLGVTAGGRKTGAAFQGAAWARYDQWVKPDQLAQMTQYGKELAGYQRTDGSVEDDDRRPPVVAGTIQTTYQALSTWRQLYARTADDAWLGPIRNAEAYLTKVSGQWSASDGHGLLDLNYAMMGLLAAGVKPHEASVTALSRRILSAQRQDGGWGLAGERSDAFATGQSLYALKLAGRSDRDPAVERGMRWLMTHQRQDGGWGTVSSGQNGADKGEAMWAVLGLVTVDVMSMSVAGIVDGQHVEDRMTIGVEVRDNEGGKVGKVSLLVDDKPAKEEAGGKLTYAWDTKHLKAGRHFVDVIATGAGNKTSRQRYEVFAGDVFLTHVAARFDERAQQTEVTMRDIAAHGGEVEVAVFPVGKDGKPDLSAQPVYTTKKAAAQGALQFQWNGTGTNGKPQPRGRYSARVSFRDAKGKALQEESVIFMHDTEQAQAARYGQVEGQIGMKRGGNGFAADATVELIDERGRVVQSTRSTEQGNYRFKNVDGGKYRVRVKKDGFGDRVSGEVNPAPAAAPAKTEAMSFE